MVGEVSPAEKHDRSKGPEDRIGHLIAHLAVLADCWVIVEDECGGKVDHEGNQTSLDQAALDLWHVGIEERKHDRMAEPTLPVKLLEQFDKVADPFVILKEPA